MLSFRSKQLKSMMLSQSEGIKPFYPTCYFGSETAQ